jgi:hypothetical protein
VSILLPEFAPQGEEYVMSQTTQTPAHRGYELLEFVFWGKALRFVAMERTPEVWQWDMLMHYLVWFHQYDWLIV